VLTVLGDFNHLGGWVKDVFLVDDVDDLLSQIRQEAERSGGLMDLTPMDPAEARRLLQRCFDATEMTFEPELPESVHQLRPARLGPAATASRAGWHGR